MRGYWRKAINRALTERKEVSGLVAVVVDGVEILIERAAYDAMLEEANARLQLALDIHEESRADRVYTVDPYDDRETDSGSEEELEETPTEPDQATSHAAPADQQAPTPTQQQLSAAEVLDLIGKRLDENSVNYHEAVAKMFDHARGKVKT